MGAKIIKENFESWDMWEHFFREGVGKKYRIITRCHLIRIIIRGIREKYIAIPDFLIRSDDWKGQSWGTRHVYAFEEKIWNVEN